MTTRYPPKPWKKVNARKMSYPHENGDKFPAQLVTMYLDPRGSAEFCFMLPAWVRDQLAISDEVRASTADAAAAAWERIVDKWSLHVRTARAEPIIILEVGGRYEDDEGHGVKFGQEGFYWGERITEEPKVGMSVAYELAFRVNGSIHSRKRDQHVDDEADPKAYIVGHRKGHQPSGYVLDYTPELHARIDEIRSTLSKAGMAMEAILKSANPAAALLASKAFRALPAPSNTIDSRAETK